MGREVFDGRKVTLDQITVGRIHDLAYGVPCTASKLKAKTVEFRQLRADVVSVYRQTKTVVCALLESSLAMSSSDSVLSTLVCLTLRQT